MERMIKLSKHLAAGQEAEVLYKQQIQALHEQYEEKYKQCVAFLHFVAFEVQLGSH